ncbi:MAG TPA: MFS transporter [Dehalococcoidia bacterium]|nr:MFS transporter [Dehalococcoidia bacterium]
MSDVPALAAERRTAPRGRVPVLGLGANWPQFALLVATNAFVGGMVGLERSVLPVLARDEFGIASKTVGVSFIASFGLAKALTNLYAGWLSERSSRRRVLIAGWLAGLPVPLIIILAPSWSWVIAANALLGVNQGLAWSMTVNMKVDLVGPRQRGLALGINEAAGYLAVGAGAFLAGVVASAYGLRPEPWYLGIAFAAIGLALSVLLVRDTTPYVRIESAGEGRGLNAGAAHAAGDGRGTEASLRRSFARGTWGDRHLVGASQAGFVNNLNDGLAWGILPLYFAGQGLSLTRVSALAALYPLIWGALQLATGWASDLIGRKPMIVAGMLVQAGAIAAIALADTFAAWAAAVALLGAGTAMVYPALLAATSDATAAGERATALGVYRFWRDAGAIVGALAAGALSDLLGFEPAIAIVAAITAASGYIAFVTLRASGPATMEAAP